MRRLAMLALLEKSDEIYNLKHGVYLDDEVRRAHV